MNGRIEYFGLRSLLWLLGILPAPLSAALGKFLAWVWYLTDRTHRAKILFDMNRTPLTKLSPKDKKRFVRAVYFHYGVMIAELAKFYRWPADRVKKCIDFTESDLLSAREVTQTGALFITAHLGNWELTGMSLALNDFPIAAVARPLHNVRIDEFLNRNRTRFGQKVMSKFNVMLEIIRNLKEGMNIGVLIDQDAERDCVYVPFLGETAGTYTVQAKLAVRYKLPVFCVVSHRVSPFQHRLRVVGPIEYPTQGDDAIERTCAIFNEVLSGLILEHPEQWLWLHHRWRSADKKGLTKASQVGEKA